MGHGGSPPIVPEPFFAKKNNSFFFCFLFDELIFVYFALICIVRTAYYIKSMLHPIEIGIVFEDCSDLACNKFNGLQISISTIPIYTGCAMDVI